MLDHISIYFLIAGTHTPLLLLYLDNEVGRFYLILIWALVALGVLYKLFFFGKSELVSVIFYMVLGWMAVFTLPKMYPLMAEGVMQWIIAGGIFYTLGVIFYIWDRLPFNHSIWHLFVIAGSSGHFAAVLTAAAA